MKKTHSLGICQVLCYNTPMLKGEKHNKLTFIKDAKSRTVPSGNTRRFGLFLCECGNTKEICISAVKRGVTKACGCVSISMIREIGKRTGKDKASYSHGFFGTRFYKIYAGAKQRCENKNSNSYRFYGGVGIKFFYKDFLDFKEDLYESYLAHVSSHGEKETTLERIDSSKGYQRGNCTWATYKEQARNRKNNLFITIKERTLTLAEWKEKTNLSAWQLLHRYHNQPPKGGS